MLNYLTFYASQEKFRKKASCYSRKSQNLNSRRRKIDLSKIHGKIKFSAMCHRKKYSLDPLYYQLIDQFVYES